tara:strand:+ start:70 stop:228 length:159 start_codon:yes stop_codon:yes gene_type:complete
MGLRRYSRLYQKRKSRAKPFGSTPFQKKIMKKQYNYYFWDLFPFGIIEDIRG